MHDQANQTSRAILVRAGASRFGIPTPFFGVNPNDLKLSSKDSGGKLSTFYYAGMQKVGPGMHVHPDQDEIFYVINGSYIFIVDQQKQQLQSGDLIFLPRNLPHAWIQTSEQGEMFYFLQPAGKMEEFFLMMTETAGKAADAATVDVGQAFGILNAGPGLRLDEEHIISDRLTRGFVLRAGASRFGETTKLGGVSPNDIKVSGEDTGAQLSIFEYAGSGKGGPPLHVHPHQDEIFYNLQGDYLFQCAQEIFRLHPGDMIFLPRGVAHTWAQLTDEGKLLFFFQPAGQMEDFFRAVGSPDGQSIPEGGLDLFQQHDMQIVGPPLDYEHELA